MRKKLFSDDQFVKVVYKSDQEIVVNAVKLCIYSSFGVGALLYILSHI